MEKKKSSKTNTFSSTSINTRIVYDKNGHLSKKFTEGKSSQLHETIEAIISGIRRKFTAFEFLLHQSPFAFLKDFKYINILKLSILAIIMFIIWHGTLAIDVKPTNFASNNTTEKIQNKRTVKKVANTTTNVLPSNISFDLSPASSHELSSNDVSAYVKRFSQLAVNEMDRVHIPASISMAQAIIESRAGKSVLSVRNNNHFGIKCFSRTCPKGHCSNYTDDHHKDFFKIYKSANDSWDDHSRYITQHQYKSLLKYGKNYKGWARGLRDIGYATDPNYDAKLISIIERYKLYSLDDL